MTARRGVALGGFMGSGKSTVGRALARRLGWPFVDADAVLAERYGPIPEQFARDGEPAFRAREAALLDELADDGPRVLATGGGAWVDPANRARLRRAHHLVVLDAPLAVLAARVSGQGGRPLWDDAVAARYESRRAAYADADLHVDASRPMEEVVEEVLRWLARR